MKTAKTLTILAAATAGLLAGSALTLSTSPAVGQSVVVEGQSMKVTTGRAAGEAMTTKDISLAQAQAVIAAAEAKAREMGLKQDLAVVDAGGNLKAFARMDGAWIGSIDIAIKKAKTARYFDMPTGDLGELSQPGKPLYMIEVSNDGLITFPGGIPLKAADGTVIGAIGSSGSTVENDHAVAEAGVAALK